MPTKPQGPARRAAPKPKPQPKSRSKPEPESEPQPETVLEAALAKHRYEALDEEIEEQALPEYLARYRVAW